MKIHYYIVVGRRYDELDNKRNRSFPRRYPNFHSKRELKVTCPLFGYLYLAFLPGICCSRFTEHLRSYPSANVSTHAANTNEARLHREKRVVAVDTHNLIASAGLKIELRLLEYRLMKLDVNYSFLRVLFRKERSLNGSSYMASNR